MNSKQAILPDIEPGVIRTFTGKMINVFKPDPELICIEDIAHALSNLCRFGGHTRQFYSVAQHSILVAFRVSRKNKIAALLHDASEAYLVDIPTPIKIMMPEYYVYEYNLMEVIAKKFRFEYPFHTEVELADRDALRIEWNEIVNLNSEDYTLMRPNEAKSRFLNYFEFQMLNY